MSATSTTKVPVAFGDVAERLRDNGYRPIPLVTDTKIPVESGWTAYNERPWTEADLRQAIIYHGEAACGIALPDKQAALDLDITDPELADEAKKIADQLLGVSPLVRIGLAPKSLRLYRAVGSVGSRKPHPLELFCGTGQVAVFGWHQKARRPYQWPNQSPLVLPADAKDIPIITEREVVRFLRAVAPQFQELRRRRQRQGRGHQGIGREPGGLLRELLNRGFRFRHATRRVLEGAEEGGRHHAVLAVVSTGYNRGLDADELQDIVHQYAPDELLELVIGDGYLDRVLDDFMPAINTVAPSWARPQPPARRSRLRSRA